jgi:hypothetical protein
LAGFVVFAAAVEAPLAAVVAGAACSSAGVEAAVSVDFLDRLECLALEAVLSVEAAVPVAAAVSVDFLDRECFAVVVPVSVEAAAVVAVEAAVSVAVDLCERFFFAVVLVVSVACGCELNKPVAEAGSRTRPATHTVSASSLTEDEEYLFCMEILLFSLVFDLMAVHPEKSSRSVPGPAIRGGSHLGC